MKAIYQITAHWDKDTGRWTALSDDIPGLVVEAENFNELQQSINNLTPQLLDLNGAEHKTVPVNIIANHSMIVEAQQK